MAHPDPTLRDKSHISASVKTSGGHASECLLDTVLGRIKEVLARDLDAMPSAEQFSGYVNYGCPLRGPGVHRRLGADVVPADEVIVDVPGCEADHAIAFDRADALAIEADEPEPLVGLREGDPCGEQWMFHGELDSVVLG